MHTGCYASLLRPGLSLLLASGRQCVCLPMQREYLLSIAAVHQRRRMRGHVHDGRFEGKTPCSPPRDALSVQTYGDCTFDQTQGCCGAGCATYIPTCACNCGRDFRTITSVPCGGSQSCIDTCISSYGACTQDNTQACCGNDCINAFPSCTCMCGMNQYTTLPMSCGSAQQCVQACLQTVAQCSINNVYSCCGSDCSGFLPTCRCQCGSNVYFATSMCGNAEQCTNACILQYGYVCTPKNTIGCCNGTICTTRNRFVGVSETSTNQLSFSVILFAASHFLLFI